jgi:hypothetical protein
MTSGSLSGAEAVAATRFQEQAVLFLHLPEVLKQNAKLHSSISDSIDKNDYENFVVIDPNTTFSSEVISGLTKSINAKFFSDIPPSILSLLTPSVKLYKVFYLTKDKGIDWQIPFDDYLGSSDFSSRSVDELLKNRQGRLNGAGIRSFSYSYLAINPAEVETNIEASLEITLTSAEDLLKEIPVTLNDQQKTFKYTDLINQTIREKFVGGGNPTLAWNSNYYRIKALIGYAVPDNLKSMIKRIKDSRFETDEDIDGLISAIRQSKVLLYLNPVSHEVDFTEAGMVNLSIKYRASIDTILSQPETDLFCISDKYQEYVTNLSKLSALQTQLKADIKAKQSENRCGEVADILTNSIADINKLKGITKSTQSEVYSSIIENIINSSSLYAAEVKKEDLGLESSILWFDPDVSGYNKIAKERVEKFKSGKHQIKIYRHAPTPPNQDQEYFKLFSSMILDAYKSTNSDDDRKDKLSKYLEERKSFSVDNNTQKYYYFYLGDLINTVLKTIHKIQPETEIPRVILGPITVYLPTATPLQLENKVEMNIADLPISLNLFQEFFIEKVVKPTRSKYPLKYFLNDVFEYLVTAVLSPRAFGSSYIGSRERFTLVPLTVANPDASSTDLIFPDLTIPSNKFGGKFLRDSDIKIAKDKLASDVEIFTRTGSTNYIVAYASSQFPTSFARRLINITETEKAKLNIEKGIFNFNLGTDLGLIKSVKFKKIDQPFLREARATNEGEIEEGKFVGKYNADVSCFGNNIFRPGDIVYINPNFYVTKNIATSTVGGGISQDQVKKLIRTVGIGGYYMINKINTSLSTGKYETNFDCIFQAYGDGTELDTSANNAGSCSVEIEETLRKIKDEEDKQKTEEKITEVRIDPLKTGGPI